MSSLRERFMDKVTVTETCWIWNGAAITGAAGSKYGVIGHGGTSTQATLASWRLFRGFLPDESYISQMCGASLCVKPDHLKATTSDEDRFYDKVNMTESCWLWDGAKDPRGYGRMGAGARKGNTAPSMLAHRFAWELFNGPIPKGKHILHNCPGGDNPSCVNPAHLRIGTHAENMADGAAKGQHVKGEAQPSARLTEAQVREIRRRYENRQFVSRRTTWRDPNSMTALAKEYGVGVGTIYDIVHRKTWRHI